jgi:prolyl oligopeptidase
VFYFRTDLDAPRYRIIAIDVRDPKVLREVVGQQAGVLEGISLFGDRLWCTYLSDVKHEVRTFGLDGKEGAGLKLPGIGSVGGFTGKRNDKETFFSFTGFTTPTTIYRLDLTSTSSRTISRRSRSSTRVATARECRCSSSIRKDSRSTGRTRRCSTATAASISR